ncbi:MAG: hypothetical protein K0R39_2684 [Symbiobacteriaceae bacterium]|nr:hypothetical protein [Symbiobacteriaceae bacterium]
MAGPPMFQRSPRLRPELPAGEVEIAAPPTAPTEPSMSVLSILLSMAPGLLGAVIMYGFSRSRGAGGASYMLMSLPMMAAGYLVQIIHFGFQKKKYHAAVAAREGRYRDLLGRHRRELERNRQMQQESLRTCDPHPEACLERAAELDHRLWERSPADDDFLSLRLGLGRVPFGLTVKVRRQGSDLDADQLQQEAEALAAEFGEVPGVPVRLPLKEVGAAGLVGERAAVLELARTLAMQLATHHSPDDLKIVALFPEAELEAWAWLRWLPHVWSSDRQVRYLAADRETAHRLLTDIYDMLQRRKLKGKAADGPALVVILGDPALAEHEPAIPLLLREGTALGACALVLAGRKEELPMECRAIAEVGSGRSTLIQTIPGRVPAEFMPDACTPDEAERFARVLAPVQPHRMAGAAAIPSRVSLWETLAVGQVEELNVAVRWRSSEPYRSLAAPVGARAGGERLLLDLHERAHGPHGLIAGATGSGKSELLQTLIASLAASYHPHEVAFVMVDYKGGGMANAFAGLPHLAGTITNLEGGLARRALSALKAELKRRQRLLGDAGVTHIDDHIRLRRQGRALAPLPHLILVVDEFAELKAEQPDFMRELISAVRVGRSLGVHLILATQKPAGVVDEQIWSNSRFRLCLRVERPEDSQEVLRSPDAAGITGAGRAYFQVGNNERFELFQAGWGGAPRRNQASDPYAVAEVGLDGSRFRLAQADVVAEAAGPTETQLEALVAHLQAVAAREGIDPVPGPWLPPLPAAISVSDLVRDGDGGGWLEPVVGLVDDPESQSQTPLRVNLGKDGHLAVFGAPGNGKTTLLQTLALALGTVHTPAEVNIYLMDGSGKGLLSMAAMPHVGGVVAVDEAERVGRLLRHLVGELDGRKERFARVGVGTFAGYRQAGGEPLPALVLMLDNYPALAAAYEFVEELVARLAREGGSHGIHLVVTAGSPAMLRHRVASNVTMAVALGLADRGEYSLAVGRTGGLEPANLPGRGLVKGAPPLEFQTALPAAGESDWERSVALKGRLEAMNRAWTGPRPWPVRTLPEVVEMSPGALGLEVESLEPFRPGLAEGPNFLVSGPPECGKSNMLRAWVRTLAEPVTSERLRVWLVDPGAGGLASLRSLPQVQGYGVDAEGISAVIEQVSDALAQRRQMAEEERQQAPPLLMVVDDFDVFRTVATDEANYRLEQLVRRERGMGFHLVAAGPTAVFSQYSYEGLVKALLEPQTGFVLGSNEHADVGLFGMHVAAGEPRRLPPGQGYYVRRGRARAVKVALAEPAGVGGVV